MTIVAVIHQPRASVFRMFDDVILLSEGKSLYVHPTYLERPFQNFDWIPLCRYVGPQAELSDYLKRLGCPCPADDSIADWMIDVISAESPTCQISVLHSYFSTDVLPVRISFSIS